MFKCELDWYLIPLTELGSILLIFHTLTFYAFAVLIWYVSYYIPSKYGLIRHRDARTIKAFTHRVQIPSINQDMIEDLSIMKENDKFAFNQDSTITEGDMNSVRSESAPAFNFTSVAKKESSGS